MYPAIVHVAEAQLADWHRQADHYSIARAARLNRKRRYRRFVPGALVTQFVCRVRALLAARSRQPPVSPPGQASWPSTASQRGNSRPQTPPARP